MTWILDMAGYSQKTAPPLSVSKQTVQILQAHYPEVSCLLTMARK